MPVDNSNQCSFNGRIVDSILVSRQSRRVACKITVYSVHAPFYCPLVSTNTPGWLALCMLLPQ